MKKSKIIVPALGLLLLSTAASVSGTVAWFTANRTFNTSAGNFAVVKTNTDLNCVMAAGVGTMVNGSGSSATIQCGETGSGAHDHVELSDASYDHVNNYSIQPDTSGTKIGKSTAQASINKTTMKRAEYTDDSSETHVVYNAVTWTMDFSISYTVADTNSGLFLAPTSKFVLPDNTNFGADDAGKGFRLAFVPITEAGDSDNTYTAGSERVLAGGRSSSDAAPQYVANNSVGTALSGTAYASGSLMLSDTIAALPNDGESATSAVSSNNNYLGKFVATAGKTMHLKFLVVGWFEGTDANVTNDGDLVPEVKCVLSFEIRNLTD